MKRVYDDAGELEAVLLYSRERIADEVRRLAQDITDKYQGEELVLLVVLKGAFFFAADLARQIRLPLTLDFVQLASYCGMASTGTVTVVKDISVTIADRHVLVIEDIVDTGLTLRCLLDNLSERKPRSLRVCALIDKTCNRQAEVAVDFVGIQCSSGFLLGYGLDLNDRMRALPAIYEAKKSPSMEV